MLTPYYDEDYEVFVYDIADIKTELGQRPHTRNGLLERTLTVLEGEQKIMILDWRVENREGELVWKRMLMPSDTVTVMVEYFKSLPEKKQEKLYNSVEYILRSIAWAKGWFND